MIIRQCKLSEWHQPPGQGGVWEPVQETRDVTPAPPNPPYTLPVYVTPPEHNICIKPLFFLHLIGGCMHMDRTIPGQWL